jgi:hypothetical protein
MSGEVSEGGTWLTGRVKYWGTSSRLRRLGPTCESYGEKYVVFLYEFRFLGSGGNGLHPELS